MFVIANLYIALTFLFIVYFSTLVTTAKSKVIPNTKKSQTLSPVQRGK